MDSKLPTKHVRAEHRVGGLDPSVWIRPSPVSTGYRPGQVGGRTGAGLQRTLTDGRGAGRRVGAGAGLRRDAAFASIQGSELALF